MLALGALDSAVMALYMGVVLAIGWQANRKQKSSEDYFLGGRRLRWWVVGISLLATSFSAVSLMGGTGFGYTTGMKWLQLQLGDLLALVAVCFIFLPFFSILRLTTAYEYLEVRFGVVARSVAAALFIIQTLLRASILIYTPALAMSALLGWEVETAILVAAAAAILYSGVILFAVAYCLVLVAGDVPGGLGAILDHAREGGRLEVLTVRPERGSVFSLVGSLVPYGVLALSLFGTGQQAVQRFLSCTDLGAARRAALTGWAAGTVTLGLTLFLGVCLYS
ncbi:MAG: sodium:solute symporter family transporter, partial [Planctomycetota bacterium]